MLLQRQVNICMIKFIKKFIEIRKRRKAKPMGATIIVEKDTNPLDVDLVDNNLNTKDKKKLRQFTKILVTGLTIMACVWITISYIYAGVALFLYGIVDPLMDLSKQVCVTVIGVTISYCLKAFFESFAEAKHIEDMAKIEQTLLPNTEEDDGAVG